VPQLEWWSWVLGHVDWTDDAVVLDVGCGPGNYLAHVRGIGLDLSAGMAKEASRHAPTTVGDVCRLPIATSSIDRLLAPHMLYHAPDLDLAASELRRVLKGGGVALVVTNGRPHLRHLVDQISAAAGIDAPVRFADRFTLENGLALLQRHFDGVRVEHARGELVVPFVEPVVRYADSCRALYETQLPDDVTWEESMRHFAELVEHEVNATGAWRTPTHSGVFVCR
ncbi:MAG TPA: class I SAM-dependent methyltransferase, partial [Acidimicrobiales bacterium]|nr:class I SAM-dependent methyltransferase [Acidimicrobiales bacterium]